VSYLLRILSSFVKIFDMVVADYRSGTKNFNIHKKRVAIATLDLNILLMSLYAAVAEGLGVWVICCPANFSRLAKIT
jgi:hypothetical protein